MVSDKFLRKSSALPYKIFMYIATHQEGDLLYQKSLEEHLNAPYTTINYHITKFKQEGLISIYLELTDKGKKLFKYIWENCDKKLLRAHNIQVKFNVFKCPRNFPEVFSKLIYQPITNKKYKGIKAELNGITLMFYSPKKIVCTLKDIYADNDEEISSAIQILVPDIKKLIELEFEGVVIGGCELAKIQSMHVAVLDSIIAKNHVIKGFTLENKDYAIDRSKGRYEVELTNPSNALRDIMDLVFLENKAKKILSSRDYNNNC
jgi:DNA-binding MarR family transcriptional regulator